MNVILAQDDADFSKYVADTKNRVIFAFIFAEWSQASKRISPQFEKLSDEFPDLLCVKVDFDHLRSVAKKYSVTKAPTFLFIKNGKTLGSIGAVSEEEMKKAIQQYK